MEIDAEPTAPQRVPELWFEDGNLVIQAGNSMYRVFRGILAARSPVFQDMLSFPQPPDSELVEGCPIVHLHDSAADVHVFLKAIFDSSFFLSYPVKTDLDTISGCLRLSHKYGVEYLQRRALIHLSSAYPTTLVDADAPSTAPSTAEALKRSSWSSPRSLAHSLHVIQLVRAVDSALWILPLVFYNLSVDLAKELLSSRSHTSYHSLQRNLSIQDQGDFFLGHHIQMTSAAADVMRFLSHPVDIEGCTSSARCSQERLQAIERNRPAMQEYPSLPLDVWDEEDWDSLEESDLCPACIAVLKKTHQDARQAFWDGLPKIYGLPSWKDLEEMKTKAIGNILLA
ncbi:hypothetical protein DFH06DRAFT_1155176 [Mycena polygramma]|nr:hypothetical protein DFH06DRAFT_1155176 [Mycena polygramma]